MANLDSIAMLAATDGILVVDKPAGISLHDMLRAVKNRFNLVKAGHGGTLEPNASGVSILLLGDATRLSGDFMSRSKCHEVTLRLGRRTSTFDREGEVVSEKPCAEIDREKFESVLLEFRGDIFQTPPEYSAIKRHDSETYEIVRSKPEDLKPYLTHVFRIKVLEFDNPMVKLEVLSGKGLCARAMVDEIGRALGCGASIETLRRTAHGKFRIENAIGFMELLKLDAVDLRHRVLPMSEALGG